MVKNGQKWSNGLKWSDMVPNGPIGPEWFKMVKNCEKCQKRSNFQKMVKIAPTKKQARLSSEDAQAGYAQFEKVWVG